MRFSALTVRLLTPENIQYQVLCMSRASQSEGTMITVTHTHVSNASFTKVAILQQSSLETLTSLAYNTAAGQRESWSTCKSAYCMRAKWPSMRCS